MGVYFEGKHIQKLSDLPAELTYVYNSQDLEPLREWFSFSKHICNAYVSIEDGEYVDMFYCNGFVPMDDAAVYRARRKWKSFK